MTPKYPEIIVTLSGHDGNAFTVLGRCRQAARQAGLSEDESAAFMAEATSGDYDHLLRTAWRCFDFRCGFFPPPPTRRQGGGPQAATPSRSATSSNSGSAA